MIRGRTRAILTTKLGISLVGAGTVGAANLRLAVESAPVLVAADGGARAVLAAGFMPELVIGDLDSLGPAERKAVGPGRLLNISEQETTDFEKCLARLRAPFIIALGFGGPRIDHALAAWQALVRYPQTRCIVLGGSDLIFAAPAGRRLFLDLPAGSRLSLFPLGPVSGRSVGLAWPIDGLEFTPLGRTGVSNRVTGPVELEFDAPGMLVILPRRALPAALHALRPSRRGPRPARGR